MTRTNSIENLAWLDPDDPYAPFPDPAQALSEPNGLLAFGGDLSVTRLLRAYQLGIFPWYSEGQPIMWWSPHPRMVLFPANLKVSRSLAKTIRKQTYTITLNNAFPDVIAACAAPRKDAAGTWITTEMQHAYQCLHEQGHAHSVETWQDGRLVGGLYGIAIGKVFFGESMFTRASDASKVAFVQLVSELSQHQFELIDCQVDSEHLQRFGAMTIPRSLFLQRLQRACAKPDDATHWQARQLNMDTQ